MDLLIVLIIGGVVGWLASVMMRADAQMGIVANVIIGIVGSLLGHALANRLGVGGGSQLAQWVISILGAVLLIALLRALGVFRRSAWR
jgi:uncharacterized membrane protein YeaQ/YmgE (transglycosylase-associated protein family)